MCVARLCTDVYALDTVVETDTQQGDQQRKPETNLGSYSVPTQLMSLSHDDSHAIIPRQQGNLRLTHLHCSQCTLGVETRDV